MESIFDWSVILSIVGVLVIVTNIVVQVLKKLTWDKLPTNILAVLIAIHVFRPCNLILPK